MSHTSKPSNAQRKAELVCRVMGHDWDLLFDICQRCRTDYPNTERPDLIIATQTNWRRLRAQVKK